MKNYNRSMWGDPGRAFIYNVHRYWMFNVVAHKPEEVGAVLIRALEPRRGMETMRRNRAVENLHELASGPGKLTLALRIDRDVSGVPVTSPEGEIFITDGEVGFEIGRSHRIGVRKDLERKLRFFIRGNKFVSR
jgi:DNA-3-methyladenine glycosylase